MNNFLNILTHAVSKTLEPRAAASRERRRRRMKEWADRHGAATRNAPSGKEAEPEPQQPSEAKQSQAQAAPQQPEDESPVEKAGEASAAEEVEEPVYADDGGWGDPEIDELDPDELDPCVDDPSVRDDLDPQHLGIRIRTEHELAPSASDERLRRAANVDPALATFSLWVEQHAVATLDAPGSLLGGVEAPATSPSMTSARVTDPTARRATEHGPAKASTSTELAGPEVSADGDEQVATACETQTPVPSPDVELDGEHEDAGPEVSADFEARVAAAVAAQLDAHVAAVAARLEERASASFDKRLSEAVAEVEERAAAMLEERVAAAVKSQITAVLEQVDARVSAQVLPFARKVQETLAPLRDVVNELVDKATTESETRLKSQVTAVLEQVDARVSAQVVPFARKVQETLAPLRVVVNELVDKATTESETRMTNHLELSLDQLATGVSTVLARELRDVDKRMNSFEALLVSAGLAEASADRHEDEHDAHDGAHDVEHDRDDEATLVNASTSGLSTGPPDSRPSARGGFTCGLFVPPEVSPENQSYFEDDEIAPLHEW